MSNFAEITAKGVNIGGFVPEPGVITPNDNAGTKSRMMVDSSGNLVSRTTILTDEGNAREDFTGTTITKTLTGNFTFTNGSTKVTSQDGTFCSGSLNVNDYIRVSTHSDTALAQIAVIVSPTEIHLASNYTGVTATGQLSYCQFAPQQINSNGSYSVANSKITIASGTQASGKTIIQRAIDYMPIIYTCVANMSQRIANQDIFLGLTDDSIAPINKAWFRFNGTVNTTVICESSCESGASDTQATTITMPQGDTSADHRYRVEVVNEAVTFYIDDIVVAQHKTHLPKPYAVMDAVCAFVHGAGVPATSTNLVVDCVYINNCDEVQIASGFGGLPTQVDQIASPIFTGSAALANTDAILALDVSKYRTASLQIAGTFSGTLAAQFSNDGVTFSTALMMTTSAQANPVTSTTVAGLWSIPIMAKYLKIRMTARVSGTALAYLVLSQNATPVISTGISGAVTLSSTAVTGAVSLLASATASGTSPHVKVSSGADTMPTSVKATAGRIALLTVHNLGTTVKFLKLYQKTSAPVSASDTPAYIFPVPPNNYLDIVTHSVGLSMATGIAYQVTTGIGNTDTGIPAANEVVVNINYI